MLQHFSSHTGSQQWPCAEGLAMQRTGEQAAGLGSPVHAGRPSLAMRALRKRPETLAIATHLAGP